MANNEKAPPAIAPDVNPALKLSEEHLDTIEADRAADFFRSQGIDLDEPSRPRANESPRRVTVSQIADAEEEEELGEGEDEEAAIRAAEGDEEDEAEEPPPARRPAAAAVAPLTPQEAETIAAALLGRMEDPGNPASAHFWRRQAEKQTKQVEELMGQVGELMAERNARLGIPPPAAPPAAPAQAEGEGGAPEEGEIDLFDDPDGWLRQKMQPVLDELETLRAERGNRELERIMDDVRAVERGYDQSTEGAGYLERVKVFRRLFLNEQRELGFTEEQAIENLRMRDAAVLRGAVNMRRNPAELNDRDIRRWLAGAGFTSSGRPAARPAPAAEPDRRAASEAAARRSAVAGTLSDLPAAEADDLGEQIASGSGLTRAATMKTIRQGRGSFFRLAERAEGAARRTRR